MRLRRRHNVLRHESHGRHENEHPGYLSQEWDVSELNELRTQLLADIMHQQELELGFLLVILYGPKGTARTDLGKGTIGRGRVFSSC